MIALKKAEQALRLVKEIGGVARLLSTKERTQELLGEAIRVHSSRVRGIRD